MTKILVLYYSSYGHVELMAHAQAEGARRVGGADVVVKRVPELVPEAVARSSHFKVDQSAPIADPNEIDQYEFRALEISCVHRLYRLRFKKLRATGFQFPDIGMRLLHHSLVLKHERRILEQTLGRIEVEIFRVLQCSRDHVLLHGNQAFRGLLICWIAIKNLTIEIPGIVVLGLIDSSFSHRLVGCSQQAARFIQNGEARLRFP